MTQPSNQMLLSGNHAVAWGARLARPDVIPVYPITPQTPILEKITDFQASGEMNAEMLTPESEHSAMSACISASLTGARVFTATSSQGLLLMHELLHWAAGASTPIVVFNVNRTVASPWGFWPDQTDSLSQRDTGWIQLYCESPQESIDITILAYRIAEAVSLPAMANHEAFYVSHAMEPIEVPSQETVDSFLPLYNPKHMLDPGKVESFGYVLDQNTHYQSRRDMDNAMHQVYGIAEQASREWQSLTGREYPMIEGYRMDDAETVIVTMGSMCGTAKVAIDDMREKGISVGLLKVRLFRPFPYQQIRDALKDVPCIIAMDRNFSPGLGGVLHQELKAALFGMERTPKLHGLLAGVSGLNVTPEKIEEWVAAYSNADPVVQSVWAE